MLTRVGGLWIALALLTVSAEAARAEDKPQPKPTHHAPKSESTAPPRSEDEVQTQLKKANYARGGYFFAAMGLWALENSDLVRGEDQWANSWGLMLRVGGRHNRWLATELNVQYVNRFRVLDSDAFLAWGMSVNERFYFTKSRVQPFILGGIGFLQIRARDNDLSAAPGFSVKGGLGAEIYANERFVFVVEAMYNYTIGNIRNYDFVTVGAGFQFF